jgi:membrane-anchored protein YejM (alkaline phosphatase superfamily)
MEKRFNTSILDREKQIRRPINRLQQLLKDKFSPTVVVIISKHWECTGDKNFGYWINHQIICFGARD